VAIDRNNPDDPKSEYYVPRSSSVARSSSSEAVASSSSVEEREHYGKMKPQFTDTRDGKKYVYVVMGSRTWMAENLNYDTKTSGSKCYDNQESYCATYGRLYDWNTAKTACPSGWHLATNADMNALMKYVNPTCKDDSNCGAADKLKTTSGWNDDEDGNSGNGTDKYGFSALPGGFYYSEEGFDLVGGYGLWWTSDNKTYVRVMFSSNEFVSVLDGSNSKNNNQLSVRCVRD